jgi:rare lipoprotein A
MNRTARSLIAATLLCLASLPPALLAEGAATGAPQPSAVAPPGGSTQPAASQDLGVASWYGADFHGRRTSNGEVYDKEKLTCAHRGYPFGTYLLVRNLDNGSSVVVRVNDRGPFAKNRIIDLSEAAARVIGMIPTGTARVSLTAIPPEEALAWKGGSPDGSPAPDPRNAASSELKGAEAPPAASSSAGSYVRIQVASYASEANARSTVERLVASGLAAGIERSGARFRVVFPRLTPADARLVSIRLDSLGYRGYVVTTIRGE